MPAIAFDMGGVLLTDGSQTAWGALERELGLPAEQAEQLWYETLQQPADRGEIDEDEIWATLSDLRPEASPDAMRRIFLDEYQPIQFGVKALRAAEAAGWQVLLATNNVTSWVEHWKQKYDWMRLPTETVCSADLGVRKPSPEFFDGLAAATRENPAYFVDDKPENLPPAVAAGFTVILATPDGPWPLPRFDETAPGADRA